MRQNQIRPVNRLMSLVIAVLLALSCVPAALAAEGTIGTISYGAGSVNFGAYGIGYDVMTISDFDKGTPLKENQVAPHKMQITSSFDAGDTAAPLLKAALDGAATDKFALNTNEIPWNGSYYSNNFYIYPKKGLPVGNYNADIVISGAGVNTLRVPLSFTVKEPNFVDIHHIYNIPAQMTVGATISLNGRIAPPNATKTAVTSWKLVDPGATNATLDGNRLTATALGVVHIQAIVAGGEEGGTKDYIQDAHISVVPPPSGFVAVEEVVGYPTELLVTSTIDFKNMGEVRPTHATEQTIKWEYVGAEGLKVKSNENRVEIMGFSGLGKDHYIVIRATVENGLEGGAKDFVKEYTIPVLTADKLTEYRYGIYIFTFHRENGETFLGLKSLAPYGSAAITVPDEIDIKQYGTFPVKRIEDGALQADRADSAAWAAIEEITLPEGIEAVGKDNFVGLTGLHTVTLPESLKTLGSGCFRNLDSLEEIELPASLKRVNERSFIYNKSLRKVTVRGNPTIAGNEAGAAVPVEQLPFKSSTAKLHLYGLPGSHLRDYAISRHVSFSVIPEKWDYFKFANSYEDFLTPAEGNRANYNLTQRDWNRLKTNLEQRYTAPGQAALQFNALKDYATSSVWGGSCYGIALAEGLYNYNFLNTRNFGGAKLLSETAYPNQNQDVRSMLNYHFLLQRLPEFGAGIQWAFESDENYIYFNRPLDMTGHYEKLIDTVKQGPVLMSYYYLEGGVMYGHAVLVNRVEERTAGMHYRLTVEDNRYPGATALMELYLNEGGKLILRLPNNNIREEIVGIRYTGDFEQFYRAMSYDLSPTDSTPMRLPNAQLTIDYLNAQTKIVSAGGWEIELHASEKLFIGQGGSQDAALGNITVAALKDGSAAPVELTYDIKNGDDLTLIPQHGEAVNASYQTNKGYASIRSDEVGQVTLTAGGVIDAQGVSGNARISTSAGDGTLVTVKSRGGADSNIRLEPGEKEAKLIASPGSYEINMDTPDGRKTNTTVKSDGTAVTIQTPPDAPKSSGGGSTGFSAYWITAKAGPNGSITPEGETKVAFGESLTVTVTPDAGYTVDKVLLDGTKELTLTNGKYTFENVNEPYTIEATFKKADGGTEASGPNAPALPPETPAPNPATGDSWFSRLF